MIRNTLDLAGYDPYDALRGTFVPQWVKRRSILRQGLIQLRKNSPINLAPLLGVQPFVMAKAVAGYLSAAARDVLTGGDTDAVLRLLAVLDTTEGNLGGGKWGYEFDVQTRWAFYTAGSPNLIVTVFVGRALLEAGLVLEDESLIKRAHECARYLLTLIEQADGETFFSYVPGSRRLIHNANALGAGFCAVTARLTGDTAMARSSRDAAQSTVASMNQAGRWPYGGGRSLSWSDNFHTAYTLDGLAHLALAVRDKALAISVSECALTWERDFFVGGVPYYYVGCKGPIDIHSCGTAIDVASRLAVAGVAPTQSLAAATHEWTAAHMVDPVTGDTVFRRYRHFTDRRAFVRWGGAHIALGESSFRCLSQGLLPPIESALKEGTV